MEIEINFFAIIFSAIISMALGFLWYSPIVMGKPWMKLMGHSPSTLKHAQKKMGSLYILSTIATLLMALVLSHVITMSVSFFGYSRIFSGITSAFWMWLGFISPVQLTDTIFGNKPIKLYLINTGYQLVSLLTMGAILGYL